MMYCYLLLSSCVLGQAFASGTLNGTLYPVPKLNIVGNYDAFYEGQCNYYKLKTAIVFDARSSYLPPLTSVTSAYYYKFQIGDEITHTMSPRVSSILTAGMYEVSLSINDKPFIVSGSSSYGVTIGGMYLILNVGYPAPTTGIRLQVLPRKRNYCDFSNPKTVTIIMSL